MRGSQLGVRLAGGYTSAPAESLLLPLLCECCGCRLAAAGQITFDYRTFDNPGRTDGLKLTVCWPGRSAGAQPPALQQGCAGAQGTLLSPQQNYFNISPPCCPAVLLLQHWVKCYKDAVGRVNPAETEYNFAKFNRRVRPFFSTACLLPCGLLPPPPFLSCCWLAVSGQTGALHGPAVSAPHRLLVNPSRLAAVLQVKVARYNDEEWEHLIDPEPGWSREETDYLLDLCELFDLRWLVIHDRYEVMGARRGGWRQRAGRDSRVVRCCAASAAIAVLGLSLFLGGCCLHSYNLLPSLRSPPAPPPCSTPAPRSAAWRTSKGGTTLWRGSC